MVTFRIKELCKAKKITQKDLSNKIGLSQISLNRIILGGQNPSIETLEKIAEALEVPMSALFEDQNDFMALVRRKGNTYTFTDEKELKEFLNNAQ